MAIDPISKKVTGEEIKLPLDNPAIIAALQKGDIKDVHKLLSDYNVTAADLEQFAASRFYELKESVYKADPYYTVEASAPPPDIELFPSQDLSNAMSFEDSKTANILLAQSISGKKAISKGKAMVVGKAQDGAKPDLVSMQRHADEWDQYWNSVFEPKIIEAQFTQELQAKSDELERELRKIMATVTDPETMICALTRVSVEKNGLIFAQLGKKMWNLNEQSNKVIEWLKGSKNPNLDNLTAKQKLSEFGQQTTFIMNDMKSVADSVQTSLNTGKSFLDTLDKTKLEIIRKLSAQ